MERLDAVGAFFGGGECRSSRHDESRGEKLAAVDAHRSRIGLGGAGRSRGGVALFGGSLRFDDGRGGGGAADLLQHGDGEAFAACGVAQGLRVARYEAVEAVDASGSVDHMRLSVNALSFAYTLALAAVDAEVGVDVEMEERPSAEETEGGAHGAYGVANQAPMTRSHPSDGQESGRSDGEGHPREYYHLIAADPGRNGLEHLRTDASECAVGVEKRGDRRDAENGGYSHDEKEGEAGAVGRAAVPEGAAASPCACESAEPVENVLQDAHGAHRRAIDTSEKEGDAEPDGHGRAASGEYYREKLYFWYPAEPSGDDALYCDKHQEHGTEEDDAHRHTGVFEQMAEGKFRSIASFSVHVHKVKCFGTPSRGGRRR